jgi:hypothetical protein
VEIKGGSHYLHGRRPETVAVVVHLLKKRVP